jgi:hypothetical protein
MDLAMTSIPAQHRERVQSPPLPWRVVIKTTVRRHAGDVLVPVLTAVLVAVFAIAGYALTRYGGLA